MSKEKCNGVGCEECYGKSSTPCEALAFQKKKKHGFQIGDRAYFPIQMTVTDVHDGWVHVKYDDGTEDVREPSELAHISSTEQLHAGLEELLERRHACIQCSSKERSLFCIDCCNKEAWAGAYASFERAAKIAEEVGAQDVSDRIRSYSMSLKALPQMDSKK